MRKVVFYGAVSLDGYLSDMKDNLQWLFDTNLGGVSTYEAFEEQVDTIVMGRVTYEEVRKLLGNEALYPGKEKVIFSRTQTGNLEEGRFETGDIVSVIQNQKEESGKMIWIVGGGSILTPLLEADLVDEYWIQIAPVLLGEGKRLFQKGEYQQRLEFVEMTQMGEMVELHYRKK